jgi:hypothetical protein
VPSAIATIISVVSGKVCVQQEFVGAYIHLGASLSSTTTSRAG